MFRRENLRRTILLAALAALVVGGGVYVGMSGMVRAQTVPAAMAVSALIDAMQARANGLSGLSGVLGTSMIVPGEGKWSGVPFLFRGPDCYVRKDGYALASPEELPVEQDTAWCIYKGGWVYARPRVRNLQSLDIDEQPIVAQERAPTLKVRPGYKIDGKGYATDTDTLLMVNLMPRSWFEHCLPDLEAGPVEDLAGETYYTILDVQPARQRRNQPIRFPTLYKRRTPRKYYVNTDTFVCERLVWGSEEKDDPFEGAGMDTVASNPVQVGGALLPTTYALRFFGPSGLHYAWETTLVNVEVKGVGSIADSEFDAWGLYPGPISLVRQPMADPEELEARVRQQPTDAGAWLSLAEMYLKENYLKQAREVIQKADALFADKESEEYHWQRAAITGPLMLKLTRLELKEEPRLEEIFTQRAQRFRDLGDARRAQQMEARADEHRQRKEEVLATAALLKIAVEPEGEEVEQ